MDAETPTATEDWLAHPQTAVEIAGARRCLRVLGSTLDPVLAVLLIELLLFMEADSVLEDGDDDPSDAWRRG